MTYILPYPARCDDDLFPRCDVDRGGRPRMAGYPPQAAAASGFDTDRLDLLNLGHGWC